MMKRLLVSAFLLLALGAISEAQETYSITANASQASDLRTYVLGVNRAMCRRRGLAPTCTQAESCTAAGAGASCTAAQARAADARIWPDSVAGREEFVTFVWVAPSFILARAALRIGQQGEFCIWWRTASQANKDSVCTTAGLGAGCEVCPES